MAQAEDKRAKRGTKSHEEEKEDRPVYVLRLRRDEELIDRRVSWDAGVVEHPNQRTSKKCCQFHKKRLFGESDSDSSSSSDSSDDETDSPNPDVAGANPGRCGDHSKKKKRPKCTKESCFCNTRFA